MQRQRPYQRLDELLYASLREVGDTLDYQAPPRYNNPMSGNKTVERGGRVGGPDGLRVGIKIDHYHFMSRYRGKRSVQVMVGGYAVLDEEFNAASRDRARAILGKVLGVDEELTLELVRILWGVDL